jgi:hypothetical protein
MTDPGSGRDIKLEDDGPLLRPEREKNESIGSKVPNMTASFVETAPGRMFYR